MVVRPHLVVSLGAVGRPAAAGPLPVAMAGVEPDLPRGALPDALDGAAVGEQPAAANHDDGSAVSAVPPTVKPPSTRVWTRPH
jgi:hypothetical protein